MSDTLQLLKELIRLRSITPEDAGCQKLLMDRLKAAGFKCKRLTFDGVENFWAFHGEDQPRIIFAGHTDVVPPGDEKAWKFSPFSAIEHEGYLYGRGAVDMKSGLAAMVVAAENFVKINPHHQGSIGFIITSDEEGPAINGTKKIVDYLQQQKIKLDYCVVGEASSNEQLGDAIKIGRRGSMHGELTIIGKQNHIAYPHLADNPIHRSFQALDTLAKTAWDQGNEYFTPTTFQFYQVHADGGAANVIPASFNAKFNFRYAPVLTTKQLQQKCEKILRDHGLTFEIKWLVSSQPFFSGHGKLAQLAQQAIKAICQMDTIPNTYGGTSDGRFIAATGCEVIEFGPVNRTAHHVNEHIRIADLDKLSLIFLQILTLVLQET